MHVNFHVAGESGYFLESKADVIISVIDLKGREIRITGKIQQEAGIHESVWNINNQPNYLDLQGIYICRFVFRYDEYIFQNEKKIIYLND